VHSYILLRKFWWLPQNLASWMQQSPSWETNSHLATQEIPFFLWNPKVLFHVNKGLPCPHPLSLIFPDKDMQSFHSPWCWAIFQRQKPVLRYATSDLNFCWYNYITEAFPWYLEHSTAIGHTTGCVCWLKENSEKQTESKGSVQFWAVGCAYIYCNIMAPSVTVWQSLDFITLIIFACSS
jgi:hypothetical protein